MRLRAAAAGGLALGATAYGMRRRQARTTAATTVEVPSDGPFGTMMQFGDDRFAVPLNYYDNEVYATVHTADPGAATAMLPSDEIAPARWWNGRALVTIMSFRYGINGGRAADGESYYRIGYGEVSTAILVTRGPAPRMVPTLNRTAGGFVIALPLTAREHREGGRHFWGYPEFIADMECVERPDLRETRLYEEHRHILSMSVSPRGKVKLDDKPLVSYSSHEGRLLETRAPAFGYAQTMLGSGSGSLILGNHPMADQLRDLGLDPDPVMALNYVYHRCVLPAGEPIGSAREFPGYPGSERLLGRYTVQYPHIGVIDLNDPPRPGLSRDAGELQPSV